MKQPMMNSLRWLSVTLLVIVAATGCGGGGPQTHSVSGKVTFKGNPVAQAQVGFVPTDGTGEAKPAQGQTDASGNYSLTTYLGPGDNASGAMAGKFKVTVTKGLPQGKPITYEELAKFKSEIPEVYADTVNTPLTAEVSASGSNHFDFVLEGEAGE